MGLPKPARHVADLPKVAGVTYMNRWKPVSPKHFAKTLRRTSQLLLEYHEENGMHHIDEVTKLLVVLSNLKYTKVEETGEEMYFIDFVEYMGGD